MAYQIRKRLRAGEQRVTESEVYHGVTYVDGVRVSVERKGRVAA